MFVDDIAKKYPSNPLNVTVDVTKDVLKGGYYLGYKIDHTGEFRLLGLFNDKTIEEMQSDTYKNQVIDKYKQESTTMALFGAAFSSKTVDEVLGHQIMFVPVDTSIVLKYDIKQVKEEPTEETK